MNIRRLCRIQDNLQTDIIFICTLVAYSNKCSNLHWAAANDAIHKRLDEFHAELDTFKDDLAEGVQGLYGQFGPSSINPLPVQLPDEPSEYLKSLKEVTSQYFNTLDDEGLKDITSSFLASINKYGYLFNISR